jgi:hypothetical protein
MITSARPAIRVASILIPLVLAIGISVGYTVKVDRESDRENAENDRKWCTVLILLDDSLKKGSAPNSPFAQAIRQLRVSLGC